MHLSLLLVWIPLLIFTATAAEFKTHYCGLNTTSYINTTTYYPNLVQVLDSLASDYTTIIDSKFLNMSAGNRHPDIAYGLYLCRADVLSIDCHNCLLKARDDINKTCPFSKEVVFWNDHCMLRYANYSMVSMMDSNISVPECNKVNTSEQASEQTQFWKVATHFMGRLATRALVDQKNKFAFDELSYNSTEKVYGYVQCTPDLSHSDCDQCLGVSIDRLQYSCYGKRGARVLTPSCNVRFEIYKFFEFPTTSSHTGKKKISPNIIAAIVAIVGVLVVIVGICHLFVKKKRCSVKSNELKDKIGIILWFTYLQCV